MTHPTTAARAARPVSVPDPRAARPGTGRHNTDKVMNMTATQQPGNPVTRRAKTVFGAVRHLNDELTGAGEAMARSNRFPQARPQGDLAQAKQAHPAPGGKVLAGV